MNITITPAAERFMRRMVRFGGAGPSAGFRLTVSPGGCSGYSSEFNVESEPRPGDATLDVNGLKLFLPAQSRLLLEGHTVDFAETAVSAGLTFFDPKAAPGSACGTSHSANPAVVATVSVSSIGRRS
ncbi:IscN protein [Burkholderiales bacterium GJ-E10]|nr:IscN protein [Burkholderiales bacterium GJ-E10]